MQDTVVKKKKKKYISESFGETLCIDIMEPGRNIHLNGFIITLIKNLIHVELRLAKKIF